MWGRRYLNRAFFAYLFEHFSDRLVLLLAERDGEVVAAIERYSVSGDIHELDGLDCECKQVWQCEIELDKSMPIPLGSGKNRRGNALLHLRSP